jgi:hypothetical protein
MLPVLLEALRISIIFNLTGVIFAEMYAPRDGIGHQIATWGENFQMRQLLAGVVMIAGVAMAFNGMVRWVETKCSLANVNAAETRAARRRGSYQWYQPGLQDLRRGRGRAVGKLARHQAGTLRRPGRAERLQKSRRC